HDGEWDIGVPGNRQGSGLIVMSYAFLRRQHMRRRQAVAAVGGGQVSAAALMLASETDGMAISALNDLSMIIKWPASPEKEFNGDPNDKLVYSSPSPKLLFNQSSVLESASTL